MSLRDELRELVEKWPHDVFEKILGGEPIHLPSCRRCQVESLLAQPQAPAMTPQQAEDCFCDSIPTDGPAEVTRPDYERLARSINASLSASTPPAATIELCNQMIGKDCFCNRPKGHEPPCAWESKPTPPLPSEPPTTVENHPLACPQCGRILNCVCPPPAEPPPASEVDLVREVEYVANHPMCDAHLAKRLRTALVSGLLAHDAKVRAEALEKAAKHFDNKNPASANAWIARAIRALKGQSGGSEAKKGRGSQS
jgi:hypothetical protein